MPAWLRDPAPLIRTNVEGSRHVLDAAVDADPRRFVFTSTIGTIGIPVERRPATEEDEFDWAAHPGARLDPPGCARFFFRDNRPARKNR